MSEGDSLIYLLLGLGEGVLVLTAFQTFEKSFYVDLASIAYLCRFQTFTLFVLVCKLLSCWIAMAIFKKASVDHIRGL